MKLVYNFNIFFFLSSCEVIAQPFAHLSLDVEEWHLLQLGDGEDGLPGCLVENILSKNVKIFQFRPGTDPPSHTDCPCLRSPRACSDQRWSGSDCRSSSSASGPGGCWKYFIKNCGKYFSPDLMSASSMVASSSVVAQKLFTRDCSIQSEAPM